jgi:hypothetical protein
MDHQLKKQKRLERKNHDIARDTFLNQRQGPGQALRSLDVCRQPSG